MNFPRNYPYKQGKVNAISALKDIKTFDKSVFLKDSYHTNKETKSTPSKQLKCILIMNTSQEWNNIQERFKQ